MKNYLYFKNSYNIYLFFIFLTLVLSETFLIDSTIPYILLIFFFLILNLSSIKFTNFQLITFLILLLYFVASIVLAKNFFHIIINFKFYFGFFIFVLFLSLIKLNEYFFKIFKFFLILSCFFTLFDAFIINFFKNFSLHQEIHSANFFGFYKRPPGIAGNSSISSLYILLSFFILKKLYLVRFSILEYILILLSVILLFSSTGFITLFIILFFLIFNPKKINFYFSIMSYSLFLFLIIVASTFIDPEFSQKLSMEYFIYVFEEKMWFFKHVILDYDVIYTKPSDLIYGEKFLDHTSEFRNYCHKYMGCQINVGVPLTSGDGGILIFGLNMGIFGLLIFCLIVFSFLRFSKENLFYTIFALVLSLHYGFVFFNFGQFLFAILLSQKFKVRDV